MVGIGIFSRLSSKTRHRRAQTALDGGEVIAEATSGVAAAPHGIEIATEFKPIDRPTEPLDDDQPIQCPMPEPSILNDGRIWKERVTSIGQRRGDTTEQSSLESGSLPPRRPPRSHSNRVILPSISAPEHNMLKLLDECNASAT